MAISCVDTSISNKIHKSCSVYETVNIYELLVKYFCSGNFKSIVSIIKNDKTNNIITIANKDPINESSFLYFLSEQVGYYQHCHFKKLYNTGLISIVNIPNLLAQIVLHISYKPLRFEEFCFDEAFATIKFFGNLLPKETIMNYRDNYQRSYINLTLQNTGNDMENNFYENILCFFLEKDVSINIKETKNAFVEYEKPIIKCSIKCTNLLQKAVATGMCSLIEKIYQMYGKVMCKKMMPDYMPFVEMYLAEIGFWHVHNLLERYHPNAINKYHYMISMLKKWH